MDIKGFEILVIGGGHAGIEASLICAKRGLKTALVTLDESRIGLMSCNPAIGGLAKGHMVREIDVLGGQMGLLADASCIQFKRLNSTKGPAVRGSRAQCDKEIYSDLARTVLRNQENLKILEGHVSSLIVRYHQVFGVEIDGVKVESKAVIVTTGTFLNGTMHFGMEQVSGGRIDEPSSRGLSDQLGQIGFRVGRLKTGTPPRLKKSSIRFEAFDEQKGDDVFWPFSLRSPKETVLPQISCFLGYTNERTHETIRRSLDKSPLFSGAITGRGPRYCPSIEDKIFRFADKQRHQTFLEPEGLNSDLIYLQGMSTSLPVGCQEEFVRSIEGLEQAVIVRPGYAVEYDYIDARDLNCGLGSKEIKGLYFAGQINGTSGYEEAAAQGLVAGINASAFVEDGEEFFLGRDEAYTGVLIDDLISKGTEEPYRMLTSRAEFRLHLREDNTLVRLLHRSRRHRLLDNEALERFEQYLERQDKLREIIRARRIVPNEENNLILDRLATSRLGKSVSLEEILRRHEIGFSDLVLFGIEVDDAREVFEPVEIEIKYRGYIDRQNEQLEKFRKLENVGVNPNLDYDGIRGLSLEDREKLKAVRPRTLGHASRISGVSPSAVMALMMFIRSKGSLGRVEGMR